MRPTGKKERGNLQSLNLMISLSLSLSVCLLSAALRFIEKMCICALPLPSTSPSNQVAAATTTESAAVPLSVLDTWQWIVDDNLPHTEETIREAAVSALTHVCTRYYSVDTETIKIAQGA